MLNASELALGRDFSLALTSDGLRGWGQNSFGQLGTGTSVAATEPTASSGVRGARPSLLVSGPTAAHACALIDGALACWGANPLGELGEGTTLDRYQATLPAWPAKVEPSAQPGGVALGKAHTCALDASGGIWCWGASQRRQLGQDVPPGSAAAPVRVY
jgi:alpha-tubulin suppressor-like RCC1 family protein